MTVLFMTHIVYLVRSLCMDSLSRPVLCIQIFGEMEKRRLESFCFVVGNFDK